MYRRSSRARESPSDLPATPAPPWTARQKTQYAYRVSAAQGWTMAMAAKKGEAKAGARGDDWFEALDAELEKRTRELVEQAGEENVEREELNRQVIEDFWKIWKRFNKINVIMALEPAYNNWALFADTFPDGAWSWKPGFRPAAVSTIQLVDRTMDQGRVGDALKLAYVTVDDTPHLRATFEYCEGEHYYKYSGWKRIWSVHTLYDEPIERVSLKELRKLFSDLVKVWYESHLRRNRDLLIKHLKAEFERVETFNQ